MFKNPSYFKGMLAAALIATSMASQADTDGWLRKEQYNRCGSLSSCDDNSDYRDKIYIGLNVNPADYGKLKLFYIEALSDSEEAGFLDSNMQWVPYSGGLPTPIAYGTENSMEWFYGDYPSGACLAPTQSKYRLAVGYGALEDEDVARIAKQLSLPKNQVTEEHMVSAFTWRDIQRNNKYAIVLEQDCSPPTN